MTDGARRSNLFLVYSPLHYLAAERVVDYFEACAKNCIYYLKPGIEPFVDEKRWDVVNYLPWPRFYPLPGLFGRCRRAVANLHLLAEACTEADEIVLHTPVIDSEAVNYAINYLRRRFPTARFSVRLLPDGYMNLALHPQPFFKRMMQYLRKGVRIFFPELDFYPFSGDRTGSEDPIVEKIYILPGFTHQYAAEKVIEIPSLIGTPVAATCCDLLSTALVIGQPLIGHNAIVKENTVLLAAGLRDYLQSNGFDRVLYKSHPRESHPEYGHPAYEALIIAEPLEMHLAKNHYGLIIGICSTALLTSRYFLPPTSRIVAYGLDLLNFSSDKKRTELYKHFFDAGVEIVDYQRKN